MRRIGSVLLPLVALLAGAVALAQPPNIVLIISDDQCYRDFGFMGNESVHTPHLDELAAGATRFPNGYVPSSVCSPSLATLLTGLYPHQHHIHYNHPPPGNSAFNRMESRAEYERIRSRSFARIRTVATLPRLLSESRYRSLQTGKFWEGHYRNAGFTHGMTLFQPVPGQDFGGNRRLANGELAAHGNGDFGLRIGRETMQPIEDFLAAPHEAPWFLWYAPYLPHEPHDAPTRFVDQAAARPGVQSHQLPYYASIAQFDHTVGQLLDLIRKHAPSQHTLIALVVDNGWVPETRQNSRGGFGHTRRSKRAPFDDGLRTPILLCELNAGAEPIRPQTIHHPVSSIDLVPTLLDAAGLPVPAMLPGRSLLPAARGQAQLEARPIFGEIYPGDATSLGDPSRDLAYRWVRAGNFKLIVPHARGEAPPWGNYLRSPALFDLAKDPAETTNLIGAPEHAATSRKLRVLLDSWWTPETPQR